jgi:hypothetical protein
MTPEDPAEALLEKVTPEVRPLLQELRAVVQEALPQTSERVHMGWGNIHYSVGPKMKDVVVVLDPQRAYVNLEFADGIGLPDPAGRLEGTGKRLRHAKIRSAEDARSPEIRALLIEAARLREG